MQFSRLEAIVKLTIYVIMLVIVLSGCAGFSYDNPALVGYQTTEECRIGNGVEPGNALPAECDGLKEFGF